MEESYDDNNRLSHDPMHETTGSLGTGIEENSSRSIRGDPCPENPYISSNSDNDESCHSGNQLSLMDLPVEILTQIVNHVLIGDLGMRETMSHVHPLFKELTDEFIRKKS